MPKILIILLLCTLSTTLVKSTIKKEEWLKQSKTYQEECNKEVRVTHANINDLTQNKTLTTNENCYKACTMKKHKVMDDNGKFNKSAILENLKILNDGDEHEMKIATEIIEICAETPLPADHCEAAEVLSQCLNRASEN